MLQYSTVSEVCGKDCTYCSLHIRKRFFSSWTYCICDPWWKLGSNIIYNRKSFISAIAKPQKFHINLNIAKISDMPCWNTCQLAMFYWGDLGVLITPNSIFPQREFYLEGGAMVLADGGVVCIDEFDKMRPEDR